MRSETAGGQGWDDHITQKRFTAVLAGMLMITFWPALIGGGAFFYRDYGFLGYPFAYFHQQSFLAGEFPYWNELINCGVPHFAQWNTMVLYPGSLIYLLGPLPGSLAWFCVLHLLLAGVGMFRLGRDSTGSAFAGATGGTAFPFCGMVLGCVIYPNYLVAFAWMPWLLSATRKAWRGNLRDCVPAACIGTMQMLSGAPELILLTWLMLAALATSDALSSRRWKMPARFGLVVGLVSGLTAFQLLPFFELLSLSQRSAGTASAFWSLPPAGWINFVLPVFSSFTTTQDVIVQIGQSFLPSVYLGTLTIALALTALGGRREPEHRVLAACALVFLLWSFGPAFPPWRWLGEMLPIGFARFPVKTTLPLAFIVAYLAMHGVARLREGAKAWPAFIAVALLVFAGILVEQTTPLVPGNAGLVTVNGLTRLVLLLGGILLLLKTPPRWQPKAALLLPVLICLDGSLHLPVLNPTIPASAFEPGLAIAYHDEAIKPVPGPGHSRAMLSPYAERNLHQVAVPKFIDDFVGQRLALWGNLNILENTPKVNGAATLTTRWARDVEVQLYSRPPETNAALIDFLGVSHITTPGELMRWQRRPNPLPFVSGGLRTAKHDGLPPPDWDPAKIVLLPEDDELMIPQPVSVRVEEIRRTSNRIEFTTEADQPSITVIAENWYPAWKAEVNGMPVEVHRANHAFMAIPIPAGSSRVVVFYNDRWFRVGLWLTALSIVACFGLRLRFKKREDLGNPPGFQVRDRL
ncbi:MAG: YfhO family protein [Verrucomicrobiae bacterium]|nr:YfhO family protein [Verrucomicrobiae bacterium]